MTDKQSAAPPVEREKLPDEQFDQRIMALAVANAADEFDDGSYLCFTFQFPALRSFARALLASPPIPAGQEVRMLTDEEIKYCRPPYILADRHGLFAAIQRKFCEVNAGKTIPKLAPATKEK